MRLIEWLLIVAIVWSLGFIVISQLDRQWAFEDKMYKQIERWER